VLPLLPEETPKKLCLRLWESLVFQLPALNSRISNIRRGLRLQPGAFHAARTRGLKTLKTRNWVGKNGQDHNPESLTEMNDGRAGDRRPISSIENKLDGSKKKRGGGEFIGGGRKGQRLRRNHWNFAGGLGIEDDSNARQAGRSVPTEKAWRTNITSGLFRRFSPAPAGPKIIKSKGGEKRAHVRDRQAKSQRVNRSLRPLSHKETFREREGSTPYLTLKKFDPTKAMLFPDRHEKNSCRIGGDQAGRTITFRPSLAIHSVVPFGP